MSTKFKRKQAPQKIFYDSRTKPLQPLRISQNIQMQQLGGTWIAAKFHKHDGNRSHTVNINDINQYRRKHIKLHTTREKSQKPAVQTPDFMWESWYLLTVKFVRTCTNYADFLCP